jgi:hypothetical protein
MERASRERHRDRDADPDDLQRTSARPPAAGREAVGPARASANRLLAAALGVEPADLMRQPPSDD